MPNQINYPDQLLNTNQVRPSRVTDSDLSIIKTGETSVIFGETNRDVVEIYVYDDSGTVVGHINLRPTDSLLSLTKRITDVTEIDYVNIDLVGAFKKANIQPGRYTMTTNFFRDEVGSEEGYKFYIAEISPSRTEVRLKPVSPNANVENDVFEFTTPSVSPEFAQALIDQVFRASDNFTDADSITVALLENVMNNNDINNPHPLVERINYAGLGSIFYNLYSMLLPLIREKTLDILAAHVSDIQVQDVELQLYFSQGIAQAIAEVTSLGNVNPKFKLI